MKRIDQNERVPDFSESTMNIVDDPKLIMLPVVFTKKLDKMDSIDTNWEPLSFNKITTMLIEESKPEYNPRNISRSTVRDLKSFNKLEEKLRTYLQRTKSQYQELNLTSIIERALNNIRTSTVNQNFQNEYSRSFVTVKTEPESWSSDDDEALVSVIKRKIDTPRDLDRQIQKETENAEPTKPHKTTKNMPEILENAPIKNINEQSQINTTNVQTKAKKDTTTVAEVQSQLKDCIISFTRNSRTVAKIDDNGLAKVKRRRKDVLNKSQKKNQTKMPVRPNKNTLMKRDTITSNIENQSQKQNQTKTPAQQNENKSPVALTNTVQKIKKKIKYQNFDGMSIFFFNTGLMARQQKVSEERYDIGNDGALEKFFVQSQPPRDCRRYSIEKTVCCLYKRAQVIAEILDEYDISPTAVNFLRAAHLCEVGACLCCCKQNRSAPQSDATITSRILDRNDKNSLISPNLSHASTISTTLQNRNVYPTDKIMKTISAQYNLSLALKGLITSLLTNFKGITLTAGSTGKLSAVFNTTFSSWNKTDLQLMTTILTKMKRELYVSQIPPQAFCDCVNEALTKDNLYSQASTLLGEKQLLMLKQYSFAHFPLEKDKESTPEDPKIEYFRGDPLLVIPGPSDALDQENEETKTKRKRGTTRNNKRERDQPSKKSKRNSEQGTKRELSNKSPEALRECVFVPESASEEPGMPNNYDNAGVNIKNPILQQLLGTSAPQSTLVDYFGVTQIPLKKLVSVPVKENSCEQVPLNNFLQNDNIITITEVPPNNVPHKDNIIKITAVPLDIPQTDDIVTIDLSSDEEAILP